MRVGLIFNPTAGGGRTKPLAKATAAGLEKRGAEVTLRTSARPGDATRLATELAEQVDVVTAAGGDGTVNEVINGLVGGTTPLGIVPAGTVNVLAKQFDIPTDPEAACDVILGGHTVSLDIGCVTHGDAAAGRRFVLMLGAGIDALTVRELDPRQKRRYGRAAFAWTGMRTFVARDQPPIEVIVDAASREGTFVVVGNCRYYGGRFGITSHADPTDGLLDVLVFDGRSVGSAAAFWLGTLTGLHLRHPSVSYVRGRTVELRAREPERIVWFQTDGELAGRLPVSIHIEAHSLRVLVPPAREAPQGGR